MRRLARPTLVYGAAVAAGCIALLSAAEAWSRLQNPDGRDASVPVLALETALALVMPVLAVVAVIVLSRIARRLPGVRGGQADTGRGTDQTGPGESGRLGGATEDEGIVLTANGEAGPKRQPEPASRP